MQEQFPTEDNVSHPIITSESHYPPSYSNTFADTLYNNLRDNDILFEKIIQLTLENKELQVSIQEYENILPPFLLEWWKSKSGEEKLTSFLQGLSSQLQSQIDQMNSRIYLHRGEQEVNQADYEEQLRQEQCLKRTLSELEGKFQDCKQNNKQLENEINELKEARPTLERQYLQIVRVTTLINSQHHYQQQQKGFIDSFFNDQSYLIDKKDAYYQTHVTFLQHMLSRKQYLQGKIEELASIVGKLDQKIEIFVREKREKEALKEKIIVMHQMVKAKKKQLKEYQQKTQIAQNKMKDLQRKLCDQNMEKTIQAYNQLTRKYQKLVERSLHLLGKSLSTPNLEGIERIVHHE